MERPKLLFITQRINRDDDDLAFAILWIQEFERQGFDVIVICLQKGVFDDSFPVYSLGKENGYGKIKRTFLFLKYILTLKYDRVFVHMNPEYFTVGGWYWFLRGIPTYLWYTHYTMHVHLWLSGIFSKRMFAATPQSLPQYEGNPKKVITGHGIDVAFWRESLEAGTPDDTASEHDLLAVHRICRSKRLEIVIRALTFLPKEYALTVYGRGLERDYQQEMEDLVAETDLRSRVIFKGPVPMAELKAVYPKHRIMVNMASETIDKTMCECMLFGIYPVTTKANSIAIGLPVYPKDDDPESVAAFITGGSWKSYGRTFLSEIVERNHSQTALIGKMAEYIRKGI